MITAKEIADAMFEAFKAKMSSDDFDANEIEYSGDDMYEALEKAAQKALDQAVAFRFECEDLEDGAEYQRQERER